VLRDALADDAQLVRRRAIEQLTRLGDREAWPAIEARLRDGDEWPIVVEAALGYVQRLCIADAGPAVIEVVRRGIRQGAWEPDVEMGVHALRVATRLGGATAEEARTVAARGGEVMQAAVQASRADRETCAPGP
nr:hypothetical protein [Myxococcota bacterium]